MPAVHRCKLRPHLLIGQQDQIIYTPHLTFLRTSDLAVIHCETFSFEINFCYHMSGSDIFLTESITFSKRIYKVVQCKIKLTFFLVFLSIIKTDTKDIILLFVAIMSEFVINDPAEITSVGERNLSSNFLSKPTDRGGNRSRSSRDLSLLHREYVNFIS